MDRASDRETRLVALEEQMREVLEHLRTLTAGQREIAQESALSRQSRDLVIGAVLKLNRELGAQRERYPLE